MPTFGWIAVRRHEQGACNARHELHALREEIRRRDDRIAFLEALLGLEPGAEVVPLGTRTRTSRPDGPGESPGRSRCDAPTPVAHRRA